MVQEDLHDLNSMWLYPPVVREMLAILYRDWFFRRAPACLSPVFLATCPIMTRDGQVLHTVARIQLYYDEEGEYESCLSVVDYWSPVDETSEKASLQSVEDELEALLRGDCRSSSPMSPLLH